MDNSKAAAHVAVRPSVLDTVKQNNNKNNNNNNNTLFPLAHDRDWEEKC